MAKRVFLVVLDSFGTGNAPDADRFGDEGSNTLAAVLSGAMMLRYAFGLSAEADAIEHAVDLVLESGCRTADITGDSGAVPVSCTETTAALLSVL